MKDFVQFLKTALHNKDKDALDRAARAIDLVFDLGYTNEGLLVFHFLKDFLEIMVIQAMCVVTRMDNAMSGLAITDALQELCSMHCCT